MQLKKLVKFMTLVCQTKIITNLMFFYSTNVSNWLINYYLVIYKSNYKLNTSKSKNTNIYWMW